MTEAMWGYEGAEGYAAGSDLTGYRVEATDGHIGKVDKHTVTRTSTPTTRPTATRSAATTAAPPSDPPEPDRPGPRVRRRGAPDVFPARHPITPVTSGSRIPAPQPAGCSCTVAGAGGWTVLLGPWGREGRAGTLPSSAPKPHKSFAQSQGMCTWRGGRQAQTMPLWEGNRP